MCLLQNKFVPVWLKFSLGVINYTKRKVIVDQTSVTGILGDRANTVHLHKNIDQNQNHSVNAILHCLIQNADSLHVKYKQKT